MTPRDAVSNLTQWQKIIASFGMAAGAILMAFLFLKYGNDTRSLEAKLDAHAALAAETAPELRAKADEQLELLDRMLKIEGEILVSNQRQARLLRLLCLDQVDDKLQKLCDQ